MHAEAFGTAVVRHLDRIALGLRHEDLQIGNDDRGVAVDLDERKPGEMREAAGDRRLMGRAHHLLGKLPCVRAGSRALRRGRTSRPRPSMLRCDPCRRCRRSADGWRSGCRFRAGLRSSRMRSSTVRSDLLASIFRSTNWTCSVVLATAAIPVHPTSACERWGVGPLRVALTRGGCSDRHHCLFGITSPIAPASCAEKNSRPSGIARMQRAPQFAPGISYSPITGRPAPCGRSCWRNFP